MLIALISRLRSDRSAAASHGVGLDRQFRWLECGFTGRVFDHLENLATNVGGFFAVEWDETATDAADGPVRACFDAHLHFRRGHAAKRVGDFGRESEAGLELGGLNEPAQEWAQASEPKLPVMPFRDAAKMNEGAERVRAKIGRASQIEHQVVAATDSEARLLLEHGDPNAG